MLLGNELVKDLSTATQSIKIKTKEFGLTKIYCFPHRSEGEGNLDSLILLSNERGLCINLVVRNVAKLRLN